MLSKHQGEVASELINRLTESQIVVLKGSAGVGKTFLLNHLVNHYRAIYDSPKKVLCSAPTHKATAVIRGKVDADVKFTTAHSTLQYKVRYDSNGVKKFVSVPNPSYPPLKGVKIWFIDECSMIDSEMLQNIKNYSREQGTSVVFVGDDKQLNPVGELTSPVFHQDYPTVELTEIVRQAAGNPIIELSNNVKDIYKYEFKAEEGEDGDLKGYLYTMNEPKIIEELAEINGTDGLKYLAWTNDEVIRMNTLVRRKLYGLFPAQIELGEALIFDNPYKAGEMKYQTSQEVRVQTLQRGEFKLCVTLEDKDDVVTTDATFSVFKVNEEILVLDEISIPAYKRMLWTLSKNCREKKLSFEGKDAFVGTFADVKYNHAITVHKSQGSTYRNTIINLKDISSNFVQEEKKRLLYTAITRASDLLIVYMN